MILSAHASLLRRCAAALSAGLVIAGSAAQAADTYWQSGTTPGAWSTAGNWSSGVPDSTTNALTTSSGADIALGSGAQAKSFFVEGPSGGQSQLSSGTLTLSDQLWINVATGTTEATTIPLRLYDSGSSPVSVTANNVTLGAAPGSQGGVILDSLPGGSVSLNAIDTITVGYDGSGNYVYTSPLSGTAAGSASITATTIAASVLASSGADDDNSIGTYNTGHTVTATNLNLGLAGSQGRADNYGGTWNIGNTALGAEASSTANSIVITDGGTFTNSGAFTVGVSGSGNRVFVGYTDENLPSIGTRGTLQLTGSNDLVISSGSMAADNRIVVSHGSTLSTTGNIIAGLDGTRGILEISGSSTATSGGVRLGVNAGSGGNGLIVAESTLTTNGTVRVGDKGSDNVVYLVTGGTIALTGAGKNFYVGYDKSATGNVVAVLNAELSVKATGADVVVSANVNGTTGEGSSNFLAVAYGGVVDANRTLVGNGGEILGDFGMIKGDTFIGSGGLIRPGAYFPLGSLFFDGNVDLTAGGTLAIDLDAGVASDFIDVTGNLLLGGSTLDLTLAVQEAGAAYVIAHYGTLTGQFSTVIGLPDARWLVDYNYLGLHEIAIISPVPEIDPSSFGSAFALLMASLGLVERRVRRRCGLAGHWCS